MKEVNNNKLKYSLDLICKRFLNDAYLFIDLKKLPNVILIFHPFKKIDDKYWEIKFDLSSIIEFKSDTYDMIEIIRDSTNIFYAKVEVISKSDNKIMYKIVLEGGINYNIICFDFNFQMKELTEKEYYDLYFHK